MATTGKMTSRKGRTSYIMAIVGVSLVLVLLGFLGWMGINYSKLVDYFRESVPVQVFLRETTTEAAKDSLLAQVKVMPYVKSYSYKDKETARREWQSMGNEDFMAFIDTNILPRSIEMNLKSQYVVPDTLKKIEQTLLANTNVTDVKYPTNVVGSMTILRKIGFVLLAVALILAIVVIVLIDNTIRLAMFSNRFLIKTMQMVGATRWFIAKPMNIRAIINGSISAGIAIAVIWAMLLSIQQVVPELKTLHDTKLFILLCVLLLILGVAISLFSTHRSVIKYLKMKLDDLY
ncbi:MAG: permease-like cell division protein FtsX [Chitinophagaceae bacterium]|jgi:cell division transport system permease protein|nr:permease-like cell division protein FtsX [Chitinophagaceae bacterium]